MALSVLYAFFDEVDLDKAYGEPGTPGYVEDVVSQIDTVEEDIASHHAAAAAVAHSPAELDAAMSAGKVALVHALEGGFHLGATPEEVDAAVTKLAARGVAYITLAHLFYRQVATNANAVPFIPDRIYDGSSRSPRRASASWARRPSRPWCASTCSSTPRTWATARWPR